MRKHRAKKSNQLLALLTITCFLLIGAIFIIKNSVSKSFNIKAAGNTSIATLGDSITYIGIANTSGWVNQYVADIANQTKTTVSISNLATDSITSQQLLNSVVNNQNYRQQIASAQVITLEIGYNDFLQNRGIFQNGACGGTDNQDCLRNMVLNFNNNWDSIVTQIKSLTASNSQNVALRVFDIYYSVAGIDQTQVAPYNGQFAVLNPYLSQMNSHIAQSASQNGFLLGTVHQAYNGTSGVEDPIAKGYILSDAIHPTDLGHTIIADRMLALRYAPLTATDTDLDGCSDAKELGSDWKLGGQRDPNNKWDFYDVPVPAVSATNWKLTVGDPNRPKMDRVIGANDAQAVFAYFGTQKGGPPNSKGFSYDTHYGYMMGLTNDPNFTDGMFYDRTPNTDPNQFWKSGPPAGVITSQTTQYEFSLYSRGGSNCN